MHDDPATIHCPTCGSITRRSIVKKDPWPAALLPIAFLAGLATGCAVYLATRDVQTAAPLGVLVASVIGILATVRSVQDRRPGEVDP